MWVILTYDVGVKRNSRVRKICRKYLLHVQKSVFEGSISESSLKKLQKELEKKIDPEEDQIAIYRYETSKDVKKDMIGFHVTEDNII